MTTASIWFAGVQEVSDHAAHPLPCSQGESGGGPAQPEVLPSGGCADSGLCPIATHQVGDAVLVVEQEAIGTNTATGVQFALPNVWVIEVDSQGLIISLRDYVNPIAVADALGDVSIS